MIVCIRTRTFVVMNIFICDVNMCATVRGV